MASPPSSQNQNILEQKMTIKKKSVLFVGVVAALAALTLSGCSTGGAAAGADTAKGKIYVNLSYSGNNWQDEGANLAMAVANSPEVLAKYDVSKVISGSDPQKQISDLQSMIAEGAKLIVLYPISPTALNPVIQQGCDAGVVFVAYDGTVEAPCAWNISYITGAKVANPEEAFFGAQTAQALVDLMGGKGNVMMNRGVAGTSTDTVHYDTAMSVFSSYPGIKVVNEFYGNWDSSVSQQEATKAIAAHPEVNGIWSQAGEDGVIKALEAAGMQIPVTGENSNYFRMKLSEGWPGVSSGSPPAQGAVAVKLGLKILADGADSVPKNIEMPLPWVTTQTAKVCPGAEFLDGCNFFAQADDSFVTEIFEKTILPESSFTAATTGAPFAKLVALPDMSTLVQPDSRRIYTRGACDSGWKPGAVMSGQVPVGLPGCVK
jgi:ribose transport system substrate-binding protein